MTTYWFALIVLGMLMTALSVAVFFLSVEVKAMQKSTHTIQYVDPLAQAKTGMQDLTNDVKSKLHEDVFEPIV